MKKDVSHSLQDQGLVLADIARRINLLPEVRESRIREIQFRIEAGLYSIDPRKIAERVLLEL